MAVLGLSCSDWASLAVAFGSGALRLSSCVVHGLSRPMASGILASQPETESASPALEGGFLTTWPSEKSRVACINCSCLFNAEEYFLICIYQNLFIHAPINWHLVGIQTFALQSSIMRSNCQHSLDHRKRKGISEKHLFLLHWLC